MVVARCASSFIEEGLMRRLLWSLGFVIAFGAGVAAGGLPLSRVTTREGDPLQAEVRRLQLQVDTLQARLRVSEGKLAGQRSASGVPGMTAGAETRAADRSLAAAVEGAARPGRAARSAGPPQGDSQDDLSAARPAARGKADPAATVQG